MGPREEGTIHPAMPPGIIAEGPTKIRGDSTGNRPTSNERPMRDANATRGSDFTSWSDKNQGRFQPSDTNRREIPEPQSEGNNDQAVHSRDATAMVTEWNL